MFVYYLGYIILQLLFLYGHYYLSLQIYNLFSWALPFLIIYHTIFLTYFCLSFRLYDDFNYRITKYVIFVNLLIVLLSICYTLTFPILFYNFINDYNFNMHVF